MQMHIHPSFSRKHFFHTVGWALLVSCLIVAVAATLARATLNLAGALTSKPDLAVRLLLPNEGITDLTLIRETETEHSYLAETETKGPELVRLRKGTEQWFVEEVVPLRAN